MDHTTVLRGDMPTVITITGDTTLIATYDDREHDYGNMGTYEYEEPPKAPWYIELLRNGERRVMSAYGDRDATDILSLIVDDDNSIVANGTTVQDYIDVVFGLINYVGYTFFRHDDAPWFRHDLYVSDHDVYIRAGDGNGPLIPRALWTDRIEHIMDSEIHIGGSLELLKKHLGPDFSESSAISSYFNS